MFDLRRKFFRWQLSSKGLGSIVVAKSRRIAFLKPGRISVGPAHADCSTVQHEARLGVKPGKVFGMRKYTLEDYQALREHSLE